MTFATPLHLQNGMCLGDVASPLHLPCNSHTTPLHLQNATPKSGVVHLPCISPTSPLHLPCTTPPPLYREGVLETPPRSGLRARAKSNARCWCGRDWFEWLDCESDKCRQPDITKPSKQEPSK